MSRSRKLVIVGFVLLIGFGLAWPFRKTESNSEVVESQEQQMLVDSQAARGKPSPTPQQSFPIMSPAPHVVAKMTNLGGDQPTAEEQAAIASFDLTNHPALADSISPQSTSPVTPPLPSAHDQQTNAYSQTIESPASGRPTFTLFDQGRAQVARKSQRLDLRHVVENSDTLEKLAKRYLGDESRSLEIFDLNRDVLDNPHLLPINAELRLPEDAKLTLD